jgi:hypothetical protein
LSHRRALDLRGEFDAALEFYQAAVVAAPARRTGAMYSFVCATLRDHGIEPSKGATKIEPEAKNHPAKETDKSK